jgi:DNA-binding beta-propeller fold protein YncE
MVLIAISFHSIYKNMWPKLLLCSVALLSLLLGWGSYDSSGEETNGSALQPHIYVTNTREIIRMDDMSGTNCITFGNKDSLYKLRTKQFDEPRGLYVDKAGKIYVTDGGSGYTYNDISRIVRMDDMSGTNWTALGSTKSSKTKHFHSPEGLFVDEAGKIYVTDTNNSRIVRMNSMTGASWTTFSSSGNHYLYTPYGIYVDKSGKIYVTDANSDVSHIVRMDDMSGRNWITFGKKGSGANQFYEPHGIFVDMAGKIYIADTGNDRIVRMDDITGSGWTTLGTKGDQTSQFNLPYGIFVDTAGKIYVTDAGNNRIVRMDDMTGTG